MMHTYTDLKDMWPLIWGTLESLTAHYGPAIDREAEDIGIPYGEWYGWLMAASIFEPDPVSAARLCVRAAYTNPELLEQRLQTGIRLGLLMPSGNAEYRLTVSGHDAVRRLIAAAYGAIRDLMPLAEPEMQVLLALLRRLVEASLAAPEPPGKWCLHIERHYDPQGNAGWMPQLDQYLSDLVAYRDDAHLAAWQPYGMGGQHWETLTHLWEGDYCTLEELCAKHCVRRGYSCESYAAVLDDLIARGLASQQGDTFRLTEAGQALRDAAEAITNRYFFAPWAGLSAAEMSDLRRLLVRTREMLYSALISS